MRSLSTPAAIVIGLTVAGVVAGGLSGVGLYLGLRARGVPATPQAGTSSPATESVPSAQPAPVALSNAQAPTAPGPPPTAHADVREQTTEGFDAQHARLVKECWEPSVAKNASPPSVTIPFDVTYDAAGHMVARTVNEDPRKARPDVTMCVQRLLEWPPVAASGARTRVRVVVTLP